MSIDRSIRITVEDTITDAKWQALVRRVLAATQEAGTTTTTNAASYAAGSNATDQVSVAIA